MVILFTALQIPQGRKWGGKREKKKKENVEDI